MPAVPGFLAAPGSAPGAPAPSPVMSIVAPLISAASRSIPSAMPISVLQAPSTPPDQPAPATQGAGLASALPLSDAALDLGHAVTHNPLVQGLAVRGATGRGPLAQSIAGRPPQASAFRQAASSAAAVPRTNTNTADFSPAATTTAPTVKAAATAKAAPAATPTPAAPEDPAALDALARQLYGRFSRHLAGELLIDRERAQFLTDLA